MELNTGIPKEVFQELEKLFKNTQNELLIKLSKTDKILNFLTSTSEAVYNIKNKCDEYVDQSIIDDLNALQIVLLKSLKNVEELRQSYNLYKDYNGTGFEKVINKYEEKKKEQEI